MKLKLLVASIFALLSLVAYQKYSEYSTLTSIDSYESCIAAKGSLIQESYPATCVTRLGTRFTQSVLSDDSILPPNTYNFCGSSHPKTSFSFVPPEGWKLTKPEGSPIFQKYRISNPSDTQQLSITCGDGFGGGGCNSHDFETFIEGNKIPSCTSFDKKTGLAGVNLMYFSKNSNDEVGFSITGSLEKRYLDQILSTFHFLD